MCVPTSHLSVRNRTKTCTTCTRCIERGAEIVHLHAISSRSMARGLESMLFIMSRFKWHRHLVDRIVLAVACTHAHMLWDGYSESVFLHYFMGVWLACLTLALSFDTMLALFDKSLIWMLAPTRVALFMLASLYIS